MSLLDWLKRGFVPLERLDPRFGEMTFQRMGGEPSLDSLTIKALGASVPRYEVGYVEIDGGERLDFEMECHEPHALRTGG